VPVYYLGTVRDLDLLYREFHPVTLTDTSLAGRIAAGVTEMARGRPLDPDYHSAWPSGTAVGSVSIESGVAVIDFDRVEGGFNGGSARATQQQLVWTVTAIAADAESPVDGVRLLLQGSPWETLGTGVLRRTASIDTVAPVWLIAPQEGETVGRNVRVHIDGAVFEATVHLRVRNSSGAAVVDQSVMLSNGAPARGEAYVNLTLTPGSYTVEAFFYSAADGSVQGMDDHEITVS
jgi:hypothetical protein